MKNRFLLFTALVFFVGIISCNAQDTKTKQLTKKEFLIKVVNYEKDTATWNYLGDKPVIIDFYADWCRPCKIIAPHLEELANEYDGQIIIYKVNVDKEKQLAKDFGIASIPTLLFIPAKGDPRIQAGLMTKDQLKEAIDSFLLEK